MNTQYNKATYSALAGALTTIIFYVLSLYEIRPGADVAAAVTTVIVALMAYLVPNAPTVRD
jgi:ABC-type enterobactin transport system permease subunit